MNNRRNATYSLEEAAHLAGCTQEMLADAVASGALATTGSEEEPHVSWIELERWWRSLKETDRDLWRGGSRRA